MEPPGRLACWLGEVRACVLPRYVLYIHSYLGTYTYLALRTQPGGSVADRVPFLLHSDTGSGSDVHYSRWTLMLSCRGIVCMDA